MRWEAGNNRAIAGNIINIGNPLTATARPAIFIGAGAFAIAIGADRENELLPLRHFRHAFRRQGGGVLILFPRGRAQICFPLFLARARAAEDGKRHDFVAILQAHPAHTG